MAQLILRYQEVIDLQWPQEVNLYAAHPPGPRRHLVALQVWDDSPQGRVLRRECAEEQMMGGFADLCLLKGSARASQRI